MWNCYKVEVLFILETLNKNINLKSSIKGHSEHKRRIQGNMKLMDSSVALLSQNDSIYTIYI